MTRSTPPQLETSGTSSEESLLGGLPVHDLAPERAERIRRQAHVVLRQRQQHASQQPSAGWGLSFQRFVEPAVLIGLGLWQLAWTVQDTVALFH